MLGHNKGGEVQLGYGSLGSLFAIFSILLLPLFAPSICFEGFLGKLEQI